ncbi:hypothetical protein [Pantanalinema sp. GBBB05]|uniref:hypothetical protein n=1 Tax=Pantanalinema sp. GBBB05 TaxID=2604139 RepID=UPI001E0265FF|nr:hypothetical protein [Pantanalinema sp. GBBB05]
MQYAPVRHQSLSNPPHPKSAQYPSVAPTWGYLTTTFLLTGLLSVGFISGCNAAPAPDVVVPTTTVSGNEISQNSQSQLPPAIATTLRQDLSQRTKIPVGKLRVSEATAKTWANGCLELAKPDEMCSMALVNGWRVVLTDGSDRWVYRTDDEGRNFRMETAMPPQTNVPQSGQIQSSQIPTTEMPPNLQKGVVLRSIASGGFIGRTVQTTLMSDGQLIQETLSPTGSSSNPQVRQLSRQQVRQFQQMVDQYRIKRFDRQNFAATPGSADFMTVTLSGRFGTVRYADSIQSQLPPSLQQVIETWNQLTRIG